MGLVFSALQKLGIRLNALQFVIVTNNTGVTGCHVAALGLARLVFGGFVRGLEDALAKHGNILGALEVVATRKSCTVKLYRSQPDSSLLETLVDTTAEACRLNVLVGLSMDSAEALQLGIDTITFYGLPPKA